MKIYINKSNKTKQCWGIENTYKQMIGRLFKSWVGREKRRRRRCKCRIEGADLSTGKKEKKSTPFTSLTCSFGVTPGESVQSQHHTPLWLLERLSQPLNNMLWDEDDLGYPRPRNSGLQWSLGGLRRSSWLRGDTYAWDFWCSFHRVSTIQTSIVSRSRENRINHNRNHDHE